jgi:hypothetical protein
MLGVLLMGIPGCMENIALLKKAGTMLSAKSNAWTFLLGGSIWVRIAAIAESLPSPRMRKCSIVAANIPWSD